MLTKKQKQILDFIKGFIKDNDYSPTYEEIKKHFKLSSVATVHQHITALVKKSLLKKAAHRPRSVEIKTIINTKKKTSGSGLISIPLLGIISAGAPIEAIEEKETIEVPATQLSKSGEHYALRIKGDSMVDEGIFDGDIVVIRKQPTAENGETVVALLSDNEVTLKKIYKEKNGFRLQPANPNIKPIFARELVIQGKVVNVIRNFEELKNSVAKTVIKKPGSFYANAQLLKRERKVKNRGLKEKLRGGTKYHKKSIAVKESTGIEKFVNQIICGDSEELLKKIPAGSIDIIITSPPYNFGLEYREDKKNDALRWEDYFKKLLAIWKECARVLKPGGRLCINIQPLFSDYTPTHHIISKQLLDLGLLWKGEILWDKHNYNCKYTAWGSWRSPSMPYLKYTWEFIEIFCKETHKKTGEVKNIDITGDEFKKWVYAKWDIAPERNMKKYEHPAMFPEELVYRLLRLLSYKNDIVLDPFNGVGTTTVSAKKTGRRFIGIDISKEYCNKAIQRLNEMLL